MCINFNNIRITLDPSVKHISNAACMALSGVLENGIALTADASCNIIIRNDRIDFGKCLNPELQGYAGLIFPNFYKEYESIVYRYGNNIRCSFWSKTIDYVGMMVPSTPDNTYIYNLLYPRFA